ncbi:hypothetical protein SNE40_011150 [Patella caerulea]|uniref:Trachealess n=1 Tax=Patella caerulea TaxID=87958 RepID=A0AAN8JXC8_PATCE
MRTGTLPPETGVVIPLNVKTENGDGDSILEVRKEKSRDAARSRRGKENYEFYELAKMLPLPAAITSQLDKASIIRLSISYLKLRDFSGHGDPPWNRDGQANKGLKGGGRRRTNMAVEIFETRQGTHVLQSLDGFGFAISNDGRFLYISETVSIYLGLSQVEMTGSSIFDYVHQADHPELAEQLGLCLPQCSSSTMSSPNSSSDDVSSSRPRSVTPPGERGFVMNPNPQKGLDRSFCVRMKSTLTKRGVHVKSQGYRVVHILGRMRHQLSFTVNRKQPPPLLGLVGVAIAMPPPTITELRIDNDTFITRLTPDFKLVYCEPIICELMDLSAEDMNNKLLYDFCHAGDLIKLRKAHVDLLAKGQVLSDYYRLTNKNGGYVWIQTCATTIYNNKSNDEQSIIAINYVLSGVECDHIVFDTWQLPPSSHLGTDQSDHSDHSEIGSQPGTSSPQIEDLTMRNKPNMDSTKEERISSPPETCHNLKKEITKDENMSKDRVEDLSLYGERNDKDTKNSRRKMDKPRKRKRDNDNQQLDFSVDKKLRNNYSYSDGSDVLCPSSLDSSSNSLISPSPQDLSFKSLNHNTESDKDWTLANSSTTGEATPSSVKELEAAMNRHLPAPDSKDSHKPDHMTRSYPKKGTIQWAGSNNTNHTESGEILPATNFLRTLYANRESVIRCNNRPTFYNEMSPNLLTPPSADAYKDQPCFSVSNLSKSTLNGHYSNMATYSSASLSVSMTAASDSYGMTPPSSVSPQEKLQSPFGDPNYAENCTSSSHGNSHLTLKQPYHVTAMTTNPMEYNGVKSPYFSSVSSYPSVDDYQPEVNHETVSYEPCSRSVLPWYPVSFSS